MSQLAHEFDERVLFDRVATRILLRPLARLSDWAVTFATAVALEKDMPIEAARAIRECVRLLLEELIAAAPPIFLMCDMCNGVEVCMTSDCNQVLFCSSFVVVVVAVQHLGFPLGRARVPACDCRESCSCSQSVYDSSVPRPTIECPCQSKLVRRACVQRKFGYHREIHSRALLEAVRELAKLGSVDAISKLSQFCDLLLPLTDDEFLQHLNEDQFLWMLANNMSVSAAVSEDMLLILEQKEFFVAAEFARKLLRMRK